MADADKNRPDLSCLDAYLYDLPREMIAQEPHRQRDRSRLMVIDRKSETVDHHRFYELPDLLKPGDLLVRNNSRVIPARLFGERSTGGSVEVLLLRPADDPDTWSCLVKPGRKARPGDCLRFSESLSAKVVAIVEEGIRILRFDPATDLQTEIDKTGHMPLPPYIRRPDSAEDASRYQTIYAQTRGSVAAPTAGLHFTPELLSILEERDIRFTDVLLHVGIGTFRPVQVRDVTKHEMHEEYCEIPDETARTINLAKAEGRRVIAVGTTTTRTLESFADGYGVRAGRDDTRLFLHPGNPPRVIDGLITNFHLPGSTLLMMVAAFCGYDLMMRAYRIAIDNNYRFYSYGDAMMIL